jgi:hypothetical protein
MGETTQPIKDWVLELIITLLCFISLSNLYFSKKNKINLKLIINKICVNQLNPCSEYCFLRSKKITFYT